MSFLKKLFGGGDRAAKADATAPVQEHEGYTITATPYEEGGQFQLCGVISREMDGEVKQHHFVRADRFPTREDAVDMTFRKARQMIELMGDRLFTQARG